MSTGRLGAGDTAIQPTIFDAKGDLLTATAGDTPARIAAGNSGETLVADSSATTGLRWQGNFAAGKNKIINGDFYWNQRNFSSTTTSATYGFDRFYFRNVDGTGTYSAQTFTVGTAPVAGYEGKNFARVISSGQTLATARTDLTQPIESVRTFAGQTVTISFWAKAASGTPKVAVELGQNFGSGGSPSAYNAKYFGQVTLSTTWTRYSVTATLDSISGKTIGTTGDDACTLVLFVSAGSNLDARTGSLGIQSNTFDFWGIQVEAGSVATAFQTATGTLAGELAACQRYYQRNAGGDLFTYMAIGSAASTTAAYYLYSLKQTMRVKPTAFEYSNVRASDLVTDTAFSSLVIVNNGGGPDTLLLLGTVASGLTQYRTLYLINASNSAGYIAFSAEL